MLSNDIYTLYALLFIAGMTFAGRVIVGVNFVIEFLIDKYKENMVFTRLFSIAIIIILITFFFEFGSRHWLVVTSVIVSFAIIGTLYQTFLVGETPLWLHQTQRYDEAREVLQNIADMNLKRNYGNSKFVNEVAEEYDG